MSHILNDHETVLIDVVSQPDLALFIGSGVSRASGLPSWSKLIAGLIAESESRGGRTKLAREAFGSGDLLDAADKLTDILTQMEIASAIRQRLGFSAARPSIVHKLLCSLGPQRFVSTNYDNLIEQQLAIDGQLGSYRVVTNRHLAELADIQKASADFFVFKPHGDMNDADSIVLSRRHYHKIMLGHDNSVKATLETLFVSRPILFVGYGLRDPDMLLVLQSLTDRYAGNAGEFWAIIPDADRDHCDYWFRNYRVRIIPYKTTSTPTGPDHKELERILTGLIQAKRASQSSVVGLTSGMQPREASDETQLIRYAARFLKPELAYKLPIRADFSVWDNPVRDAQVESLSGLPLAEVIDRSEVNIAIIGSAGSGKSFGANEYLLAAARRLIDSLSSDNAPLAPPSSIPLHLDARLYTGSFENLSSASLPGSLNLVRVSTRHPIVALVDSIDEMPSEFLESGKWISDLETFLSRFSRYRVVYLSRRRDLIRDDNLRVFRVRSLDAEHVKNSLSEIGVDVGRLSPDFLELLCAPFTLALGRRFLGRRRDMNNGHRLLDVFLNESLESLQQGDSELVQYLSTLASFVMNSGRDTIRRSAIIADLSKLLKVDTALAQSLLDKLVGCGVLASEIDGHVRFVHRTVAEYLASKYLAEKWLSGEADVVEILSTRRWDDAVVWAAAGLPTDEIQKFIGQVVDVDPLLAIRIATNAEMLSAKLWVVVLNALHDQSAGLEEELLRNVSYALDRAEIPREAHKALVPLISVDGLGGAAAKHLFPHLTDREARTWLKKFQQSQVDFNFASLSGGALGARLDARLLGDLKAALASAKFRPDYKADQSYDSDAVSYRHGFATIISGLKDDLRHELLVWAKSQKEGVRETISSAVREISGEAEEEYLLSELDRGGQGATFAIYLRMRFGRPPWRTEIQCTEKRLSSILRQASKVPAEQVRWILELLDCLLNRNADWRERLEAAASAEAHPQLRCALRTILASKQTGHADKWLSSLLEEPSKIGGWDIAVLNVVGEYLTAVSESQLLNAMQRDPSKALLVTDALSLDTGALPIEFTKADDWLAAIRATRVVPGPATNFLGTFATFCSSPARARIVDRANSGDDPLRDFILENVFCRLRAVTTDDLSVAARTRVVDLFCETDFDFGPSPGRIATEGFVETVVIPLMHSAKGKRRKLLERILLDAGNRHGRRYQVRA